MGYAKQYGAYYYDGNEPEIHQGAGGLYDYTVYIGKHDRICVDIGESLIWLGHCSDLSWDSANPHKINSAYWTSGNDENEIMESTAMAVLFYGYQCGHKMTSVDQRTNLPYVNGCSTRQIFPAERIGDPTLQMLHIPPHTSEQVHHIHATPRVVYVLSGWGWSEVGQAGNTELTRLTPGMVCVLDPMCPHHFNTEESHLRVLPVHVYSSPPGGLEHNHPMRVGTIEV